MVNTALIELLNRLSPLDPDLSEEIEYFGTFSDGKEWEHLIQGEVQRSIIDHKWKPQMLYEEQYLFKIHVWRQPGPGRAMYYGRSVSLAEACLEAYVKALEGEKA